MPIRRAGIDRRLAHLECKVVRCVACAAANGRYFRVLPDDEFAEVARTGEFLDVCASCGTERDRPVKVYRESDIAGI